MENKSVWDENQLDKLIKSRDRSLTTKQFLEFLSGLALSRTYVDIGSGEGETSADRLVRDLEEEVGLPVSSAKRGVDTMSRLTDMMLEL